MTESEKAYQYFVIAVPENEEQAKAYFWARKALQPTLTPPNEWVSVEERLPNDKQIVLFRQKNGFIYCAEYFAGNSLCSPSWFIDCDCWEAKEVTHWMPLPTPPDRRPPEGEENA